MELSQKKPRPVARSDSFLLSEVRKSQEKLTSKRFYLVRDHINITRQRHSLHPAEERKSPIIIKARNSSDVSTATDFEWRVEEETSECGNVAGEVRQPRVHVATKAPAGHGVSRKLAKGRSAFLKGDLCCGKGNLLSASQLQCLCERRGLALVRQSRSRCSYQRRRTVLAPRLKCCSSSDSTLLCADTLELVGREVPRKV